MSQYRVQPRPSGLRLDETNWLAKLHVLLFRHRRARRISMDLLPDHLLRDAGLERIGGVMRRRLR